MIARRAYRPWKSLPLVAVVTAAVTVMPIALVWALRTWGVIPSAGLSLLCAVGLSLLMLWAMSTYWARRPHSSDLLFAELLPWGWLSRWRCERELASALRLLETAADEGRPVSARSQRRRARLLTRLAYELEAQDIYLAGHSRRVARLATLVGRRMGLTREEVAKLRAAAAIHDVGKLHVPHEILEKPGRLTPEEFAVIKRHPEDGASLVSILGDEDLTAIVRHHHERIDGLGYPAGLAEDQIPLGARIVAVADTFDAITSPRPYRAAANHQEAIQVLRECSGTQLDPTAVRTFLGCYSGRRQMLFLWGLLALPRRFLSPASASASPVGAISAGNLAAVAATGLIGCLAVLPKVSAAHTVMAASAIRTGHHSSADGSRPSGKHDTAAAASRSGHGRRARHVALGRRQRHPAHRARTVAAAHHRARAQRHHATRPARAPARAAEPRGASRRRAGSGSPRAPSTASHQHSSGRPHHNESWHRWWIPPGHRHDPPGHHHGGGHASRWGPARGS